MPTAGRFILVARRIFSDVAVGTHSHHQTRCVHWWSGSVLGLAAALGIYWFGQNSQVGAILLNMAVFGAVIAYILQMASFLILRRRLPSLERPYVSPWGVAGAWIASAIAAITLVSLFLNPDYVKRSVLCGSLVSDRRRLLRDVRAAASDSFPGGGFCEEPEKGDAEGTAGKSEPASFGRSACGRCCCIGRGNAWRRRACWPILRCVDFWKSR